MDVAFAVRERGGWGQGYNTEHLSLLLSGSLRSALPLDTGIEVSWPFFPGRCSTALVRRDSLTFGKSLAHVACELFIFDVANAQLCVSRSPQTAGENYYSGAVCNVFLACIQQRGMQVCSHESICCN